MKIETDKFIRQRLRLYAELRKNVIAPYGFAVFNEVATEFGAFRTPGTQPLRQLLHQLVWEGM